MQPTPLCQEVLTSVPSVFDEQELVGKVRFMIWIIMQRAAIPLVLTLTLYLSS